MAKTAPATPHSTLAPSNGQSAGPSTPSQQSEYNVTPFSNTLTPFQPLAPPFLYYEFPPTPYFGSFGYPHVAPPPPPLVAHAQSSPLPMGLSFDEICTEYKLNAVSKWGLQDLGFEMGDDLSVVTKTEYKSVGFLPLSWDQVHRAYRKYK